MDAVILPLFAICGTADALLPESRSLDAALREAEIPGESYELADVPNARCVIDALSACREGKQLMFDFLRPHL